MAGAKNAASATAIIIRVIMEGCIAPPCSPTTISTALYRPTKAWLSFAAVLRSRQSIARSIGFRLRSRPALRQAADESRAWPLARSPSNQSRLLLRQARHAIGMPDRPYLARANHCGRGHSLGQLFGKLLAAGQLETALPDHHCSMSNNYCPAAQSQAAQRPGAFQTTAQ